MLRTPPGASTRRMWMDDEETQKPEGTEATEQEKPEGTETQKGALESELYVSYNVFTWLCLYIYRCDKSL